MMPIDEQIEDLFPCLVAISATATCMRGILDIVRDSIRPLISEEQFSVVDSNINWAVGSARSIEKMAENTYSSVEILADVYRHKTDDEGESNG